MASPTQAQQPLRACSDTTSKRRQSPQASSYPRDVGRLGAEPPYDGGATTACEARQPLRNLRWQHPYDLQSHQARNTCQVAAIVRFAKEKPSPGPLSSQIAVPLPPLAPNSPTFIASRASVATLASCSYTTDAVSPHQRGSALQSASSNHPDSPQLTSALMDRRPRQLQAGQATSRDRASSAY